VTEDSDYPVIVGQINHWQQLHILGSEFVSRLFKGFIGREGYDFGVSDIFGYDQIMNPTGGQNAPQIL
jgi:hypothetical protein